MSQPEPAPDDGATLEPAPHSVPGVVQAAAGPRLRPGVVLAGRYRVERSLGLGGSGEVVAAHDQLLGTTIAIKLLRGQPGATAIARLRGEILSARKVSHPAVCRVFDLACHDDGAGDRLWFLTMELLDGPSLARHLGSHGPVPADLADRLAYDLIAGLGAAHAAGVVHRDLSAGNVVLVAGPGRPRAVITDFGLAVAGDAGPAPLRAAGTPAYMPPEQRAGQAATPASDVWALGVVLHELATGRRPEGGVPARGLPRGWEPVLRRCLEAEPARRFADARAVGAALRPRSTGRLGVAVALFGALALGALWVGDPAARPRPLPPVAPDPTGPVATAFALGGNRTTVGALAELPDGDLILGGHMLAPFAPRGVPVGGCTEGVRCGYIMRVSPRAEVRWARALAARSDLRIHAVAVQGDAIAVAGDLVGPARFAADPGAEKFDSFVATFAVRDGRTRWFHRLGVEREAVVRGVAFDPDGGVVASGALHGDDPWRGGWRGPTPAETTLFVLAHDRDGGLRWRSSVTASGRGTALDVAVAGDLVVWVGEALGAVRGPGVELADRGRGRALIGALDRVTGALRWIVEAHEGRSSASAVTAGPDGSLIVAGWADGRMALGAAAAATNQVDGWLARLDGRTGAVAWLRVIGGPRWGSFTDVLVRGHDIFATGRSQSLDDPAVPVTGHGGDDAVLVRLRADGTPVRSWLFGTADTDKGRRLAAAADGGLWLCGSFRHHLPAGSFALVGDGIENGFALELSAAELAAEHPR